jgi:hypothetical protein
MFRVASALFCFQVELFPFGFDVLSPCQSSIEMHAQVFHFNWCFHSLCSCESFAVFAVFQFRLRVPVSACRVLFRAVHPFLIPITSLLLTLRSRNFRWSAASNQCPVSCIRVLLVSNECWPEALRLGRVYVWCGLADSCSIRKLNWVFFVQRVLLAANGPSPCTCFKVSLNSLYTTKYFMFCISS